MSAAPSSFSPIAMARNWWEYEQFGGGACAFIYPKGFERGSGDAISTLRTHWVWVECAMDRKRWSKDQRAEMRTILSFGSNTRPAWWGGVYPRQVMELLDAIEEYVAEATEGQRA